MPAIRSLSKGAQLETRPTFVTMANALLRNRTTESLLLFLANGEAEYFCKRGWTRKSPDCPSGKSAPKAY
jgi:hypothetical protein